MLTRLDSVQLLRAVAALSVVLAHSIGDYKLNTGVDLLPLHYLGAAGVDLFFVLSGFVMVHSSNSLFGTTNASAIFLIRRFFRVAPLYWAVMAIYALLQISQGKWHVIDAGRIVASALFLPLKSDDGSMAPFYGIGWTLNFEAFFYVMFAFWINARREVAVSGVVATICAAVFLGMISSFGQPLQYWLNSIILDFALGVLIAMAYARGWAIKPRTALGLIVIALAAVITGGMLGFNATLPEVSTAFPRWIAWGIPAATIVAAVVFSKPDMSAGALKIGSILGDASYSMYLLHPIIIILLRGTLSDAPVQNNSPVHLVTGAAHIAVVLAVTVTLSILSAVLFERPMITFGKFVAKLLSRTDPSPRESLVARSRCKTET